MYPAYPQDFQYFMSEGVPISNARINKWIKNGLSYLNENPNNDHYSCSSGNTKIELNRNNDGLITIEVFRQDGWTILE